MELWEPWQPRVGQRVRVRLSGECRGNVFPHPPGADGRTGRVRRRGVVDALNNGHIWLVDFDRPLLDPLGVWVGVYSSWFAAVELEPVAGQS